MGQTEQGMQTMLSRILDHISLESVRATWEAGLYLYRTDFPVQLDAKVACWYGEKEGHMKKAIQKLRKVMKGNKSAQVGIAAMVSLCDCATANNTVAIIVAGDMARDVSHEYKVDPRRTASLLDIFSCVFQGIIPYGAQLLSAAALANATVTSDALHTSPAAIVGGMWYCWILAAVGLLSIFVPFADGVCRKDPWNWEYGCAQSAVAAKKALLEKEAEDISAQ